MQRVDRGIAPRTVSTAISCEDAFGPVLGVPLADGATSLSCIVHKDDEKDLAGGDLHGQVIATQRVRSIGVTGHRAGVRAGRHRGKGRPARRLMRMPWAVRTTTASMTVASWAGERSRPRATMRVVAPAGG